MRLNSAAFTHERKNVEFARTNILRSKMTPRRQLVLDFIKAYIRIHGIAPSYEVVARGLKMKSKANIHRIVHRLQADGYLSVKPHKFHSIKIVDRSVKEMAAL
jgi:SOS-response transcriptional repressor LexA